MLCGMAIMISIRVSYLLAVGLYKCNKNLIVRGRKGLAGNDGAKLLLLHRTSELNYLLI